MYYMFLTYCVCLVAHGGGGFAARRSLPAARRRVLAVGAAGRPGVRQRRLPRAPSKAARGW